VKLGLRATARTRLIQRKLCGGAADGTGILLRQLVEAEQSVAESKGFIAQHQRLIVQSERDGQDAAETIRLLDKLLLLQQSREQERARILDELSDAS
jgi:hypothetical protein